MTSSIKNPGGLAGLRRGSNRIGRDHYTNAPPSLEKIESALRHIPSDDRETWLRVGMALKSELGHAGFDIFDTWSRTADSYRERDVLAVWKSFSAGKIGIGTLFYLARANGWRPDRHDHAPDPGELERRRQAAATARALSDDAETKRHNRAAEKACRMWESAVPVDGDAHPYLRRKHVQSHGLRRGSWYKRVESDKVPGVLVQTLVTDDALLVPMADEKGKLWNLQAIMPEKLPLLDGRDKDFITGGRKAKLFFVIGAETETVLIAEGYATAATVHEATGNQTFVAVDCGNLKAVALAVRAMRPDAKIVICGDNDRVTAGNPGVTKAREAALAVGGFVSIPEFPPDVPGTDWNDLHVYRLTPAEGVRHD